VWSAPISTPPARAATPAKRTKKGIVHQPDEALGRSRGGWSTKLHLRVEGGGKPLTLAVTGGQRHECTQVDALLAGPAVKRPGRDGRPGPGRPRRYPDRLAGDKGYSYPSVRAKLRRRGIGVVIPTKSDQRRNPRFDTAAYKLRNQVERCINRLKQDRRVATRYEKRGVNYQAMVTIAMILLWL
jgi:transposase